jgi:hypothetical protein
MTRRCARRWACELYAAFASARDNGTVLDKATRRALAARVREWAQRAGRDRLRALVLARARRSARREARHVCFGRLWRQRPRSQIRTIRIVGRSSVWPTSFRAETDGSSFPHGGLRATHTAAAFSCVALACVRPLSSTRRSTCRRCSSRGTATRSTCKHAAAARRRGARPRGDALCCTRLGLCRRAPRREQRRLGAGVLFGGPRALRAAARPAHCRAARSSARCRSAARSAPTSTLRAPMRARAACCTTVRDRLWALGVPLSVLHNEVAPSQHELSPIFSLSSHAADTNVLAMETLASGGARARHGRAAPREAVRRHQRLWQAQQLGPEHRHRRQSVRRRRRAARAPQQRRFVAFIAALARSVHLHGDLLRVGVATSGNDHRLGAQEAPPAVFTLYVGRGLEAHLRRGRRRRRAARRASTRSHARELRVAPCVQPITTGARGPQPHGAVPVVRQSLRAARRRLEPAHRVADHAGQRGARRLAAAHERARSPPAARSTTWCATRCARTSARSTRATATTPSR